MFSLTYDYSTSTIEVAHDVPNSTDDINISVRDIYTSVRNAEASEQGILYPQIIEGSGNTELSSTTSNALTINLLGWSIQFIGNNYSATISEGNLLSDASSGLFLSHPGISVNNLLAVASTLVAGGTSQPSVWTTQQRDEVLSRTPTVIADAVLDTNI